MAPMRIRSVRAATLAMIKLGDGAIPYGWKWCSVSHHRFLPSWVANLVVLALVLAVLNLTLGVRWQSTATVAGLWALASVGLALIWGYAGQVSLGHGGFIAIGAYSTAILTTRYAVPSFVAMLIGVLVSCGFAFVLGIFVLKLEELYLALATLGFGLIAPAVIVAMPDQTGGSAGIYGIPAIGIGPISSSNSGAMYAFVWALAALAAWGAARLGASRTGLAWKVLAHHPTVASTCGVNVRDRKRDAFLVSAALASIAGSLFAHFSSAVTPGSFSFSLVVLLLTIVVVGGLGAASGPVVGAIVINLALTYSGRAAEFTDVVFGAIFILVLFVAPRGLVGVARSIASRRGWPARSRPDAPVAAPVAQTDAIEIPSMKPAQSATPVLEVQQITKRFGGVIANNGVSLTITDGQIHGLVGPNGAGKTTLINIATGVYSTDKGRLVLRGEDVTTWPAARRGQVGMCRTFQTPALVPDLSVLDNVALGAYRYGRHGLATSVVGGHGQRDLRTMREHAWATLESVGLRSRAELPASDLSFGQRRLAELARALALSPQLLFLDEPMSGLDVQEKAHVAQIIRGLQASGTAICLVEHDTEMVAQLCNWVTVLDFGAVLADGPGDRVFHDPRVRASYMGEMIDALGETEPPVADVMGWH